jgi:uncharacterized membrane protein YkoI
MNTTRFRRLASASVLAVAAALGVALWSLFGDPAASNAQSTPSIDINAVASKLEMLHQRTAARTQADDDDKYNRSSWGHVISPEQAASLAQQVAVLRGDATTKHNYLELQTRNGRPAYMVQIGIAPVYIDADTGALMN